MVKRSSDSKASSRKKKVKASSEEKNLSKNFITTQTNELINRISENQTVKAQEIEEVLKIYDLFLPHCSSEDSFSEYESSIRLLNLQSFKIFEKLFDTKVLHNNRELKNTYEMFKLNLLFYIENILYDCSLIIDNLEIYMKLLKIESTAFTSINKDTNEPSPFFPTKTYRNLVISLFKSLNGEVLNDGTHSSIIIQEFVSSYFQKYADLQFYFFSELNTEVLKESDLGLELIFSKFLTIAKQPLSVLDGSKTKRFVKNCPSAVSNSKQFQTEFEKKWLFFLNQELTENQYKTTLLILHKRIIPFMRKPTSLMDFLTDSYDLGGIISILSLNGLFELIKKYNLDYPNFYSKLYSLFDQSLFHVKYRSRFFRLTDIFLSSTHLPSAIVGSFIKKMSRLSISAPPSAIVIVIPFIYNLMKRHPTCMILLQNDVSGEYTDPFDDFEADPLKTNALESSLWEMETLQSHYHPNVATLAKIFSQPFKKQSYNIEDFLDWSYDSLLESESTRRMRDDVALEYESFENVLGDYLKNWRW